MKILHVNKFYYPRGGAETVYFALTRQLEAHGHTVIPFSMQHPSNLPTPYDRFFVRNVELREESGGIAGKIGAAARILYSREAERKIEALIDAERPDIAHLHNIYHQLSPSVLRALARRGVPAVMTLHDYKLICPAYTLTTEGAPCERCRGHRYYEAVVHRCVKGSRAKSATCAAEAYLHAGTGIYTRNVKYYLAPSHFLAGKVLEFGVDPRQVVYVPNSVPTAAAPTPLPASGHILYAGRLEAVKGVATLLRAIAGSDAARARDVVIAGDGEARASFEAEARALRLERVRFVGHRTPAEVTELVDGAAFVVAPSEWYENAPLSVLEAAARGRAVVAAEIGGLPELVRHGETGLVFRAGDVAELRTAMETLLGDPALEESMGKHAHAFIRESYSPEGQYRQTMAVYGRALAVGGVTGGGQGRKR